MKEKVRLLCFPYAGGSAAIFNKWAAYLDPRIELLPIELAGRGRRMHEPFYNTVPEAITDVFSTITKHITDQPYALFGHSMGGMIAYELAHRIREAGLQPPLHIFFSGRGAPHVARPDEKKYHLLNEADFQNEVLRLGGTPPEFFEHPELLELFLPLLKSDFKLAEAPVRETIPQPFEHDITVFLGKDEDLTADQCDGWKKHTQGLCTTYYFEGGHFFIQHEIPRIIATINRTVFEQNNIVCL